MSHAEFWGATPVEIAERLRGYNWRERRSLERSAWELAHIINISGKYVKRRVKPKDLLDGRGGGTDPIAHHMKMERLKKKLEKRGLN